MNRCAHHAKPAYLLASNIPLQVDAVQLEKGRVTYIGTLHLTAHHMIFFHPEQEIWVRQTHGMHGTTSRK